VIQRSQLPFGRGEMPDQSLPKSPRRWLRFSIRGLIALVLVSGVGLGWAVSNARIQRDAVAAITKAGGSVMYEWEPIGKPWAPRWLVDLIGVDLFGDVTYVWLPRTATDSVIEHVGNLGQLESLTIWSLSDAGLANLKRLNKLTNLTLYGPQITDAEVVKVTALTKLTHLELHRTHVTDIGLAQLKGLTNLSVLLIVGHTVSLGALRELNRALPRLSISH
jgi:Leucine-rich repeat (LRR) protein